MLRKTLVRIAEIRSTRNLQAVKVSEAFVIVFDGGMANLQIEGWHGQCISVAEVGRVCYLRTENRATESILQVIFAPALVRGSLAAASARNPRKFTSYRALCEHPDLAPRPGTLSVMVRVAAQEKLFELKNLPVEKLSYSHKAELVKVFDDKVKIKLFKETVKKSLNVRQLIDLVRAEKGLPPITAAGNLLEGNATRFNFEALLKTRALADPEAIKALPEKRRNELKERVEGAYAVLARLLEEYGRLKDLFAELEK
jgi:hypothetical protein